MIELEKDKIDFESSYIEHKKEIEDKREIQHKKEIENNKINQKDEDKYEIFQFTISELQDHDRKVIEKYMKSQNNQLTHKKKY